MQVSKTNQQLHISPVKVNKDIQGRPYISSVASGVSFGSAASAAGVVKKSKFFAPVKKLFKPVVNAHAKVMDELTTWLAKGLAKPFETKAAEKVVGWAVTKEGKKNKNLIAHLSVLTSLVLSGFYVKKTLDNKNLDEKKKKTLAINQAAVAILSAGLGYFINDKIDGRVDKFIKKFIKVNADTVKKADLDMYVDGIRNAKSIMVFALIYRFFSPVFVTPIANAIGNRMEAKKVAKLAEQKELNKNA